MGVQYVFSRKARSSDTFILVALCFALFTDTFVYGIIVPILPFLLMDHGHTTEDNVQQWTSLMLASYGGALLVCSPVAGYLSDKYRARKAPLISGFVAIALATILFVSARTAWVLLVARVCQGLSGAVVGVLGLSMIAETARPENLGAYMACGSTALTWGMLCGPMAGGFLFAKYGTMGAFGVPIALLVVDIVLRLMMVQEDEGKGKSPEAFTKDDPRENSPFLNDVPKEEDSLSFYHFLHPILLGVVFTVLAVSSILSAFETTLPLYVIQTYRWSSMGAGFVFLPLTIPSVLSIPIAHFVRRLKPRMIVVTGFVIMTIPMMCLRWTQANTARHETILVTLLFIIGVCLATVQAIIVGDVSNAVRRIERLYGISDEKSSGQGRGYALCNMAFAAGQAVGPIAGGYIKHELGWGVMTLFLGSLCLVAAGTSFFSVSPEPPTEKSEDDMGCCEA